MIVEVDGSSAVPPFEQIRVQMDRMISSGVLEAGRRLPTIAQLANDLGIAPGTVARAYRELESAGRIKSRRRLGTVVASLDSTPTPAPGEIDQAVADFVRHLRQLGASQDEAISRINTFWTT
jgi:GntR family transcriptional regulator